MTTTPMNDDAWLNEIFESAYLKGIIDSSGLSWFKHGDGKAAIQAHIQEAVVDARTDELQKAGYGPEEDGTFWYIDIDHHEVEEYYLKRIAELTKKGSQ